MPPEEVDRRSGPRGYVVCHGGAAMVSAAIAGRSSPAGAAAATRHRRAPTEHQAQLVRKLAAAGAVVELHDAIGEEEEAAGTLRGPRGRAATCPR